MNFWVVPGSREERKKEKMHMVFAFKEFSSN